MRRRPPYEPTEWKAFAVLTIVAIALIVSNLRARATSRLSRPERVAQAVLLPLQESTTAGWQQLAYTIGSLGRGRRLAQENDELRRANAQLESKLTQRYYEYLTYQEMLEAFGFEQPGSPEEIPARVVGRSTGRFVPQTIDIIAGGGRQLRKGDIVLWCGYLVGRVRTADGSRGRVALLLDQESGAAAIVKPSNVQGAVVGPDPAGPDPDLLRLVRLDLAARVAAGDKVYTSPIGEVYPPGVPIGWVQEVIGGAGPSEPKTAIVKPYANFGNLNYVTVVRPTA
jgi:rod shape-determining protein MreC